MGAALLEHNLSQPVLDQIRLLHQRTLRILAEAEHGRWRDPSIALGAIRECRHNLELIAKLTGELKSPAPAEPTRVEIVYVESSSGRRARRRYRAARVGGFRNASYPK
jgi:hypothetical protein